MDETAVQLRASLDKLIETHHSQKVSYEKWKTANSKSAGTEQYATYVKQFETWEKTILSRKAALEQQLYPTAAGPAGPEAILDDLLTDVKPMQFLMALMKMSVDDQTFLPALLDKLKVVIQGSQQSYQQSSFASHPYAMPSAMAVPPPTAHYAVPPPAVGVATAVLGQPVPQYMYNVPAVPATQVTVPPSASYALPASAQKITQPSVASSTSRYRAPSPVRDYNTVQTPFTDFSMQ